MIFFIMKAIILLFAALFYLLGEYVLVAIELLCAYGIHWVDMMFEEEEY